MKWVWTAVLTSLHSTHRVESVQVPRVKEKLSIMMSVETANDTVGGIAPQGDAVIVASTSLTSSEKLRKLLEVILAFGNYMNSGRRGGAWGFKLSVFDRLIDTRAPSDKSMTLMHFVVKTVMEKMPEISTFSEDLVDIQAGPPPFHRALLVSVLVVGPDATLGEDLLTRLLDTYAGCRRLPRSRFKLCSKISRKCAGLSSGWRKSLRQTLKMIVCRRCLSLSNRVPMRLPPPWTMPRLVYRDPL
jgi:hypothetical protein